MPEQIAAETIPRAVAMLVGKNVTQSVAYDDPLYATIIAASQRNHAIALIA